MLVDYRNYLSNLRNSVIQCGVEVPVTPLKEYEDIFEFEQYMCELLWFYSILEVSNSDSKLQDFILPLGGYFKDKMREIFYQEYLQQSQEYAIISKKKELQRRGLYIPSSEGVVFEEDEIIDLFDDDEEDFPEVELPVSTEKSSSVTPVRDETKFNFADVVGINKDYVSSGVFLEDIDNEEEPDEAEDEWLPSVTIERVPHGVYLEDIEGGLTEDYEGDIDGDPWGYDDSEVSDEEILADPEEEDWGYDEGNDYEDLADPEPDWDEDEDDSWGYEEEQESEELADDWDESDENWGYDEEQEDLADPEPEWDESDDDWGYDDDGSEEELADPEPDWDEDEDWGEDVEELADPEPDWEEDENWGDIDNEEEFADPEPNWDSESVDIQQIPKSTQPVKVQKPKSELEQDFKSADAIHSFAESVIFGGKNKLSEGFKRFMK